MDKRLIKTYFRYYGQKYYQEDVFKHYPEAKTLPAYIKQHCGQAKLVLDLGFGSGLWFWASFLPVLQRIDGIDLSPEALQEANRLFEEDEVPAGFHLAHQRAGECFTHCKLMQLKQKQGYFAFQDYRQPWPSFIAQTRYDLVTEHGGGLGQMSSNAEVIAVINRVRQVLRPAGRFLFMNLVMKPSTLDQLLRRAPASHWQLCPELFEEAISRAHLKLMDFHVLNHPSDQENIAQIFYGYACK